MSYDFLPLAIARIRATVPIFALVLAACGDGSSGEEDPLLQAGQDAFRSCNSCHVLDEERHRAGPHLVDLFGREAGSARGFRYSSAIADSGVVWDEESLDSFLANPRDYIPGNRMSFAGMRDEDAREALIAYLRSETSDAAD